MKRIEHEDVKRVVITRAELEADLKRGFCVLEFSPAGDLVIKNPRGNTEIRKPMPAVHLFRCMRCQYDVNDGAYPPDKKGVKRGGLALIKEHVTGNKHPWPYPLYESPYGNIEDVIIEGVADYQKEVCK